jgi:hypothetical protein
MECGPRSRAKNIAPFPQIARPRQKKAASAFPLQKRNSLRGLNFLD